MKFTIPVRTYSEQNLREHWARRAQRATAQRTLAKVLVARSILDQGCHPVAPVILPAKPWRIVLTRIGKKRLDTGNNPGSLKHVQDGICDALGIDDGDEANDWIYRQRIAKEYAVEVEITTMGAIE